MGGNQMAYYYLGAMEAALVMLLNNDLSQGSEFLAELDARGAPRPLPENLFCSDVVCDSGHKCAYSDWPNAGGPSLGDIMINESGSSWTEGPAGCIARPD